MTGWRGEGEGVLRGRIIFIFFWKVATVRERVVIEVTMVGLWLKGEEKEGAGGCWEVEEGEIDGYEFE